MSILHRSSCQDKTNKSKKEKREVCCIAIESVDWLPTARWPTQLGLDIRNFGLPFHARVHVFFRPDPWIVGATFRAPYNALPSWCWGQLHNHRKTCSNSPRHRTRDHPRPSSYPSSLMGPSHRPRLHLPADLVVLVHQDDVADEGNNREDRVAEDQRTRRVQIHHRPFPHKLIHLRNKTHKRCSLVWMGMVRLITTHCQNYGNAKSWVVRQQLPREFQRTTAIRYSSDINEWSSAHVPT